MCSIYKNFYNCINSWVSRPACPFCLAFSLLFVKQAPKINNPVAFFLLNCNWSHSNSTGWIAILWVALQHTPSLGKALLVFLPGFSPSGLDYYLVLSLLQNSFLSFKPHFKTGESAILAWSPHDSCGTSQPRTNKASNSRSWHSPATNYSPAFFVS